MKRSISPILAITFILGVFSGIADPPPPPPDDCEDADLCNLHSGDDPIIGPLQVQGAEDCWRYLNQKALSCDFEYLIKLEELKDDDGATHCDYGNPLIVTDEMTPVTLSISPCNMEETCSLTSSCGIILEKDQILHFQPCEPGGINFSGSASDLVQNPCTSNDPPKDMEDADIIAYDTDITPSSCGTFKGYRRADMMTVAYEVLPDSGLIAESVLLMFQGGGGGTRELPTTPLGAGLTYSWDGKVGEPLTDLAPGEYTMGMQVSPVNSQSPFAIYDFASNENSKTIWVVDVDMLADSNNNGDLDSGDNLVELDSPGMLVGVAGASRPLWLYKPEPGTLPEGQVYLSMVSGSGTIEVRDQVGGALIYSSDKARSANLWSLVSSMNLHCVVTAPECPEQETGDVVLEYQYVNGAFQCTDRVKVTVVKVDLDVQQVSDADEWIIGGFLGVNNVAGENNLIRLDLSHELGTASGGTFQLQCSYGCNAIKVWDSMTKVTEISLPATWAPGSVPSSLYVEGLQPVTYQGEVQLILTWFYNSPFMDFSDHIGLTVVDVSLAAEANMTDAGGRLNCMEERDVTYTATAHPLFPHGLFNPICFVFHYETAAGVPWTDTDWSTDLLEDNTATADDVLAGDADHMFTTPIYVEASNDSVQTQSNTLEVDVYELWIEYFRDASTHKDWKVVVGEHIGYSAMPNAPAGIAVNFQWDMPDAWHPTGGAARIGTDLVIPDSDMPTSNGYFGTSKGTVVVSCEDVEGNYHEFSSTDMNPSMQAKIFYSPYAMTNPDGSVPNWFYYWKEGNVVEELSEFEYYLNPGIYGNYVPNGSGTGPLHVGDLASTTTIYTKTLKNTRYQRQIHSGEDGVANTTAVPDDYQLIQPGCGEPHQIAITAGTNGILDSVLIPDDGISGTAITTGTNGICNSYCLGGDVPLIEQYHGKPYSVIITADADDYLRTVPGEGDDVDLTGAQTITLSVNFSGIDCCAATCRHELKHRSNDALDGSDSDEDGIPDSYEGGPYHLDFDCTDTYKVGAAFLDPGYVIYGDDELTCRIEEMNPGPRHPDLDWSKGEYGKNW